jgi:DMSO/TMAO reductase YedYZ molybdopterin-dependent catalytic subunit
MSKFSRRQWIAATAGASGLAVATRLADRYGLIPPDHGGIYGAGTTLTYASQRLLTHNSLAREFPRSEISKAPFAKLRPFKQETFERLRDGGFVDWRVEVGGMVARPTSFSLTDLKSLPARTQITQLACEEGWSFIAEWTGVPLSHVLKAAGTPPQARYVVYYSMQPRWWESIDMTDALHPQTLLVYGMNGGDLPMGHGGPLRMSVPRQLGYKSVKFISRLIVTDSLERFRKSSSYSWYAGI